MLKYRLRENERTYFPCPADMNPVLHTLLIQRGISSAEEAERFLNPSAAQLHDPMLLSAMPEAVARIRAALEGGEKICVYGDYDVDGVSASSLLSDYLRSCGAEVEVYLPSRHTEGYGLNAEAIQGIALQATLMITVDCGVTSVELIELAKSLGLDCIVTDHHQPAAQLPDCPVINPLLNSYPFPALCGAGVAFKLVQALGGAEAAMQYVDIAALATVADVVPLTDENRVIVKLGLDRINSAPRPGIRALLDVSGLSDKKIGAGNVAFQLAPRLNAGGRIGSAKRSYDLLLSPTESVARPIAEELEEENRYRKDVEQQILSEAESQLKDFDFPSHRILVLSGKDWNSGVIGLAASRFVEKYHYPTILLAESDGVMTGSCRSIPGVDIHAALTATSGHLIRYGGHKQAAGLTLSAENLDAFRTDIDAWLAENIPPACYVPDQDYDMEVHFDELSNGFVAALEALQPTGFGNPAPVLRAHAQVADSRGVGLDGAHLKLTLSESSVRRGGIFFRGGHLAGKLPDRLDVLFTPKLSTYMGRTEVQLEIKCLNSDDIMSELSANIKDEDDLQHAFLTEMLYNKEINFYTGISSPLDLNGLKAMLDASLQGTLILAADLAEAGKLVSSLAPRMLDLFIGSVPDDPRAFNALCVYPPAELPGHYRRVVLAGIPACPPVSEETEVFRLALGCGWTDAIPTVDQMREVYKAARQFSRRPVVYDDLGELAHLLSGAAGLSTLTCVFSLLALDDMDLIDLNLNCHPIQMKLNEMRKTDPETSAVWRAVQAWRT